MSHSIVAAVQLHPKGTESKKTEALKKAIDVIEQSGLHFHHDHFESVIEGSYEQVVRVIEAIQLTAFNAGIDELILNIRLHSASGKDLKIRK